MTFTTMPMTHKVEAPHCELCPSVDVYRHQSMLRCLDHLDEWAQTHERQGLERFAAALRHASDPGPYLRGDQ